MNYNVINCIKTKTENGYEQDTYFGTEQRFIKALLNSNNKNLEEQMILGTDCITIEWTGTDPDTGLATYYITKKFYSGNPPINGYFILFSNYPAHEILSQKLADFATVNNKTLIFDPYQQQIYVQNLKDIHYDSNERNLKFDVSAGARVEGGTLRLSNEDSVGADYTYGENGLTVIPDKVTSRIDTLCFRVNPEILSDTMDDSDIIISIKTTTERYDSDNRKRTLEEIQNYF